MPPVTRMSRRPKSPRLNAADLKHRIPDVARVASDLYRIEFRNGVAQCPFPNKHIHGDRDPSFRYDRKKNRVFCASQQCFGEKGADAFALVMLMSNCTFPEALQKLADHYGISASPPSAPAPPPPSATRSASTEDIPADKKRVTADEIRHGLLRQGYRAVTQCLFAVDLTK